MHTTMRLWLSGSREHEVCLHAQGDTSMHLISVFTGSKLMIKHDYPGGFTKSTKLDYVEPRVRWRTSPRGWKTERNEEKCEQDQETTEAVLHCNRIRMTCCTPWSRWFHRRRRWRRHFLLLLLLLLMLHRGLLASKPDCST